MRPVSLALPLIFAAGVASAGGDIPLTPAAGADYDPTLFLGLSYTFGGAGPTPGVTLKLLSTNEPDTGVVGAGLTYNFNGTFGCDLGLGYNGSDASVIASYDFCSGGAQISIGAINGADEPQGGQEPPLQVGAGIN